MHLTIKDMETYLASQNPDYGDKDIHSLAEFLYWQYGAYNSTETAEIKQRLELLYQGIKCLTFHQQNAVTDLLTELSIQYEKEAFQEGFHLGIRLMMELMEEKKQDCGE